MKNFEEIFKVGFENYEIDPSPGIWGKVKNRISRKNFLQFDPFSFNVFYLGAVVTVGTITAYSIVNSKQASGIAENETRIDIEETIINNKVSNGNNYVASISDLNEHKNRKSNYSSINNKSNFKNSIKEESNIKISSDNSKKEYLENDFSSGNESPIAAQNNIDIKKITEDFVKNSEGSKNLVENEVFGIDTIKFSKEVVGLPEARFIPSAREACVNQQIVFSNRSLRGVSYKWSFGDGYYSKKRTPKHTFEKSGFYKVVLEMVGDDNVLYESYMLVRIQKKPLPSFEVDIENSNFDRRTISFKNNSVNNKYNKWDFGDNHTSYEETPIHVYEKQEAYLVKLIVNDGKGCFDSTIYKVNFFKGKYQLEFQNVFTPNVSGPRDGSYAIGDNNNDIFYPIHKGVADYRLYITDRSGMVLFQSRNINLGWNGYYKGELVKQGAYEYESAGKYENGETFSVKGSFSVLYFK